MTKEEWLPIPGWEDIYEVSNQGHVKSLFRNVTCKNGLTVTKPERILKQGTSPTGHKVVWLCRNNERKEIGVHRLVAAAFIREPRPGELCRHLDDKPDNNVPSNLAWGTPSDNKNDAVRNGIHPMAAKTHCKRGHEFTEENTYRRPGNTARNCRTCRRIRKQNYTNRHSNSERSNTNV